MGLLSRIKAAGLTLLRDAPDRVSWAVSAGGGGWWAGMSASGQPVTAKTAVSIPVFSACISLLSSTLASQRWQIERDLPDGGSEQIDSAADTALALTDYPTKEKFVADALLSGTSYATQVLDRSGRVERLAVLPYELMALQLSSDAIDYLYSDPLSGRQSRFAAADLAILRYRAWGARPWLGVPPLLTIGDALGVALAARGLVSSEMKNGTFIKGYLSTANKIDPQKAAELKQRWQQLYSGADRGGQTAVLEQGLEFKSIDARDLASLQMAELAKLSELGICQAFCIPPSSIGLSITDNSGRGLVIDETRRLVSLCLQPLAVRVGDAIGQLMLSDAQRAMGMRVSINLEPLIRGYGLELSEVLSRYVSTGIMSRNEARRTMGLPGRPEGDELLVPVNVETTDQAQQRQDRADQQAEAAQAAAANTNIAASLTRQLDGMRPLAVDIAGRQLEAAGVVARLEDGREVVVDLADIRKALAAEPRLSEKQGSEAAEILPSERRISALAETLPSDGRVSEPAETAYLDGAISSDPALEAAE